MNLNGFIIGQRGLEPCPLGGYDIGGGGESGWLIPLCTIWIPLARNYMIKIIQFFFVSKAPSEPLSTLRKEGVFLSNYVK